MSRVAAKLTDYGLHLREKQKVKNHYGLLERQFRKLFALANKGKGNTGEGLMSLLERRLDNNRLSAGFRPIACPGSFCLITHGHIAVNGRRVKRAPVFLTRAGDAITGEKADRKSTVLVQSNLAEVPRGRTRFP